MFAIRPITITEAMITDSNVPNVDDIGTSTTELLIEVAEKTFTTQSGLPFLAGEWVKAYSAGAPANYMYGKITSYSGTTLVVDMSVTGGEGSPTDWNISYGWNVGASYLEGDQVQIGTGYNKIYQALENVSGGDSPEIDVDNETPKWLEISATNKWKAFDALTGTQTSQATSITYEFTLGEFFDSIAFLNIDAYSGQVVITDSVEGEAYNETEILISGNDQVTDFVFSNINLSSYQLAGTYPDGQIWRSTNAGITWTLVKDLSNETPSQSQIRSLARITDTVCLAGTYPDGQIWRSTDAGETWTLVKDLSDETPSQTHVSSLVRITDTICLAGTYPDGQIWRSTDAGATWTEVKDLSDETPSQIYVHSLARITDTVCLAGTYPDGQIWRSTDAGATWTLVKDLSNETPSQQHVYELARVTDTICLAGTGNGAQIWRSTDAGATWSLVKNLREVGLYIIHSLARVTDVICLAGAGGQIWRSTDAGATWLLVKDLSDETPSQTNVHSLAHITDTICLAGTSNDGQIWRSTDAGGTWTLVKDLSDETPSQTFIFSLISFDVSYTINITITYADDTAKIGNIIIGNKYIIGTTQKEPSVGARDYSTKEVDAFGNWTIVERAFSKWLNCRVAVANLSLDAIERFLILYRASYLVWVAHEDYSCMILYGFCKDHKAIMNDNNTFINLEIEGIT